NAGKAGGGAIPEWRREAKAKLKGGWACGLLGEAHPVGERAAPATPFFLAAAPAGPLPWGGVDSHPHPETDSMSHALQWLSLLAALTLTGAARADDKSYLPGDGQLFVSYRIADVLNAPLGKEVRKGLPRAILDAINKQEEASGLRMIDLEYNASTLD